MTSCTAMYFVVCERCEAQVFGDDAEDWGWVQLDRHRWRCGDCLEPADAAPADAAATATPATATPADAAGAAPPATATPADAAGAAPPATATEGAARPARAKPAAAARKPVEPEVRGFDRPEDGSEERYHDRLAQRPWAAHTLWWVVHNAVAHPLIAFIPRRPFFRFHDWTSRKMHGRSSKRDA